MSIFSPTLGDLFNDYAKEFASITRETDRDLDISTGLIRFRLFGNDEHKNAAWQAEHPDASPTIYFVCLSSNPVEVWGDVREVAEGEHEGTLVVNHLSLGHEVNHALRVTMSNWTLQNEDSGELLSPDKYEDL